jgi:hypothetical protein
VVLKQQTRTLPPETAPLVAVLFRGRQRRCSNLCCYLERQGFNVFCTQKTSLIGNVVSPDVVLVCPADSFAPLRTEFRRLETLRRLLPKAGVVILSRYEARFRERAAVRTVPGALLVHAGGGYPAIVAALEKMLKWRPRTTPQGHSVVTVAAQPSIKSIALDPSKD